MIPNDQPLRYQTIKRMLNNLIDTIDEKGTKWEQEFVISCNEQFLKKEDLTSRQCEILERLYDK